jgi:hypothetical protein
MNHDDMLRLFEAHREAEAARDIDAILGTFADNCFLETMPLGLRSEGRDAVRAAYQAQFFTAFPDLAPEDEGMAVGEDVIAVWGMLRGTSRGEWLGVPPGGGTRAICKRRTLQGRIDGRRADLLRSGNALRAGEGSAQRRSSRSSKTRERLDANSPSTLPRADDGLSLFSRGRLDGIASGVDSRGGNA